MGIVFHFRKFIYSFNKNTFIRRFQNRPSEQRWLHTAHCEGREYIYVVIIYELLCRFASIAFYLIRFHWHNFYDVRSHCLPAIEQHSVTQQRWFYLNVDSFMWLFWFAQKWHSQRKEIEDAIITINLSLWMPSPPSVLIAFVHYGNSSTIAKKKEENWQQQQQQYKVSISLRSPFMWSCETRVTHILIYCFPLTNSYAKRDTDRISVDNNNERMKGRYREGVARVHCTNLRFILVESFRFK